jgi:hypothetical protein
LEEPEPEPDILRLMESILWLPGCLLRSLELLVRSRECDSTCRFESFLRLDSPDLPLPDPEPLPLPSFLSELRFGDSMAMRPSLNKIPGFLSSSSLEVEPDRPLSFSLSF